MERDVDMKGGVFGSVVQVKSVQPARLHRQWRTRERETMRKGQTE